MDVSFFYFFINSDIFENIYFLDIFRFLRTYLDSEEFDSYFIREFIIFERNLILNLKNLIFKNIDLYSNVYMNVYVN